MKIEIDRRTYDMLKELAEREGMSVEDVLKRAVSREVQYRAIFHGKQKELIARALGAKPAWHQLQDFINYLSTLTRDERITAMGILHLILGVDMPEDVELLKEVAVRNLERGREVLRYFEKEEEVQAGL